MIVATQVWWGRWWYDTLLLAFVAFFFFLEALLLYRKSRLSWAMTAKCIALMAVFSYSLANPPPLAKEAITQGAVLVRIGLAIPLLWVIIELGNIRRVNRTRDYPISDWLTKQGGDTHES